MRTALSSLALILLCTASLRAQPKVDLGTVTEKHEMVPMRDGTKLSVYLYFPEGKGPRPVLLEQRYADLTAPATRKSFAKLAEGGYVVAAQNFREAGKSEGQWVGYRALGWGEQKDGYDTVGWLMRSGQTVTSRLKPGYGIRHGHDRAANRPGTSHPLISGSAYARVGPTRRLAQAGRGDRGTQRA